MIEQEKTTAIFPLTSRLARRLVIYVILASTFITIFTSAYQLYEVYKADVNFIELRLNDINTSNSSTIAAQIWVLNEKELRQSLRGILNLPDIEYIKVVLDTGDIIEDGELPDTDKINSDFPLIHSFNNKQHSVGHVYIIASLEQTYERLINQAISIIMSNAIKTFIISGFLLLLFQNLVIRHLIRITEHAKNINFNSLESKLVLNRRENKSNKPDEFDNLVNALDVMKVNINKHILDLSTSQKYITQTINCINDAVITINETGIILSINHKAETLFGYDKQEIIGENVKLLMPSKYSNNHDEYLHKYRTTGKANILGSAREVEGQHKDKNVFPIRLSITELPRDESGSRRFIGIIHDLTDIKAKEEQLVQSQKMEALGKITGGISHDFNNLLGIIVGFSQLLKRKLKDHPEYLDNVEQINIAGKRGAKLTKKLLSFSSKQPLEEKKTHINQLIYKQLDMLQKLLTVRIPVVFEHPEDIWEVYLDDNQLADCILNICINAMHAMDAMDDEDTEKKLTLRLSNQNIKTFEAEALNLQAGEYVKLSIIDSGCGMEESTRAHIFDPFFTTKGEQGTGLGLSQVFGFVERSNGVIKVASKLNQGTQFDLYFPRYHDKNEKLSEPNEKNTFKGGNETLLLVDDEQALILMVKEILLEQGYQIFTAYNAQDALQILENEQIDLLLTDLIMPDMNGYQLSAIVRDKYPSIKIQMVSGFDDEKHMDIKDMELQRNIIRKPYQFEDLLNRLRKLLD